MKIPRKRLVFIFILAGLLALSSFWYYSGINFAKKTGNGEEIIFLIQPGQSFLEIAGNLEEQGLIKNKFLFKTYVLLKNKQGGLKAGEYVLSPTMNIKEISEIIYQGKVAGLKITVPEGFTLKQIEARLNANFERTMDLQAQKAVLFEQDFTFLKGLPEGASLEGFLFPDTYEFGLQAEENEIISKMINNFDRKLSPALKEEIGRQNKDILEIVIMASMLEKEVKTLEDKKIVAGILWKRLDTGMPLQVDATVIYVTGQKTSRITYEQTRIDSFYNTYKYPGLPVGPISNPGLESLEAAIYPQASPFWYYLSTPEGETIFSETLEKHNRAKAEYLK